jgi:hypothetical protein
MAVERLNPTGWLCPRCGRGCAPSMAFCPCVSDPAPVVSTRTGYDGNGYACAQCGGLVANDQNHECLGTAE